MEGFALPMFDLSSLPVVVTGSLGSLITGLLTGVGALPIFFRAKWGRTSQVIMLAVAAGVMLAATVFSLVVPAMNFAAARFGNDLLAALIASGGIASLDDIRALCGVMEDGVMGAILGRALYTGDVDFEQAQRIAENCER